MMDLMKCRQLWNNAVGWGKCGYVARPVLSNVCAPLQMRMLLSFEGREGACHIGSCLQRKVGKSVFSNFFRWKYSVCQDGIFWGRMFWTPILTMGTGSHREIKDLAQIIEGQSCTLKQKLPASQFGALCRTSVLSNYFRSKVGLGGETSF